MKEVKVSFAPEDIKFLDQIASQNKKSRSQTIRDIVQNNRLSPQMLRNISLAIRKRMNGSIGSLQADQCAAIAIDVIFNSQENN